MAEYSASSEVLESVTTPLTNKVPSVLPDWIKGGAPATLFLNHMSKPRHGRLYSNSDGEWIFCPGNLSDLSKGTILHDLSANCHILLESGQLFRGQFPRVYQACSQAQLTDCLLRRISAHGLQSLVPPSSLKQHQSMTPSDKEIWDAAYSEEFDGLSSIPTW